MEALRRGATLPVWMSIADWVPIALIGFSTWSDWMPIAADCLSTLPFSVFLPSFLLLPPRQNKKNCLSALHKKILRNLSFLCFSGIRSQCACAIVCNRVQPSSEAIVPNSSFRNPQTIAFFSSARTLSCTLLYTFTSFLAHNLVRVSTPCRWWDRVQIVFIRWWARDSFSLIRFLSVFYLQNDRLASRTRLVHDFFGIWQILRRGSYTDCLPGITYKDKSASDSYRWFL